MVKNYITADQARTLTDTSEKMLSVVFKAIKEQAEYGASRVDFCVDQMDAAGILRIKKVLTDAGYAVEERTGEIDGKTTYIYSLLIKW